MAVIECHKQRVLNNMHLFFTVLMLEAYIKVSSGQAPLSILSLFYRLPSSHCVLSWGERIKGVFFIKAPVLPFLYQWASSPRRLSCAGLDFGAWVTF